MYGLIRKSVKATPRRMYSDKQLMSVGATPSCIQMSSPSLQLYCTTLLVSLSTMFTEFATCVKLPLICSIPKRMLVRAGTNMCAGSASPIPAEEIAASYLPDKRMNAAFETDGVPSSVRIPAASTETVMPKDVQSPCTSGIWMPDGRRHTTSPLQDSCLTALPPIEICFAL